MDYDIRLISSLEKVLPRGGRLEAKPLKKLTGFLGQRLSFQAAYCFHGDYYVNQTMVQAFRNPYAKVTVENGFGAETKIRKVDVVPVMFPHEWANEKYDTEYIGDEPGLYPDVLSPIEDGIQIIKRQWRALWIDVMIPEDAPAGDHVVEVVFTGSEGEEFARRQLIIHVVPVKLPKQRLIHTEWFHSDCLADYYHVEVFSEEHWRIIENFVQAAVNNGINMIIAPLFTLALDTLIGGERTTTQLVQVEVVDGEYQFDFSLFRRWVDMCKRCGVEYYEMSHLFTQWGAKFPPKVVATVNGKKEKIFGWQAEVKDCDYPNFLAKMLPLLVEEIEKAGIADKTFFHVSDEPTIYNKDTYSAGLEMVKPYIKDMPVLDALSHLELYKEKIVTKPVPTNDSLHEFLDAGLTNGWCYYCCAQGYKVANRYIAMPAYRSRILGVQMYKYQMEGFLQWGFNFYNSQYSLHKIDPYTCNDGEDAFPSGDTFIVYPGKDGEVVESMRLPIVADAMYDIRLFDLLESLTDREFVMNLIEDNGRINIRFDDFPYYPEYLLDLWERAAAEVEKRL